MKRLVAVMSAVLAACAVTALSAACGPKDDKPPMTPDDPSLTAPPPAELDAGAG